MLPKWPALKQSGLTVTQRHVISTGKIETLVSVLTS